MSKTDIKQATIATMTVGAIVDQLSAAYIGLIDSGLPVDTLPAVMLWGPPGVGKSQAVRQIAEKITDATGRPTNVIDARLLLFNPIDLRGIPTANAEKTLAVWLKPKIFDMDPSPYVVNILFLDEISAAPQSVQAAAYQITLDRTIGEHKLPDNCIVICAGNRVTDRSVAFKMPKALANRLLHLEVETDVSAWRKWAVSRSLHPKVLGFLGFRPNLFMTFDPANDDLAFATPRAWEMVSRLLTTVNEKETEIYPLIAGLVGTGTATEFLTWCKVWRELPDIPSIFDGKYPPIPQKTDVLYALVAAMTDYASKHRRDVARVARSIPFADHLPADFSVILLQNYLALEDGYKLKLLGDEAFKRWFGQKGRYLNGAV